MSIAIDFGGVSELPDVLTVSALDTARFGRPIGRLSLAAGAHVDPGDVRDRFNGSDLDVLVLRYPADNVAWFASLESPEVTAIHADNLVHYAGSTVELEDDLDPPPVVDGAELGRATLGVLTRSIFADHPSHVAANPLLDATQVAAGYEEWVKTHLDSPNMAVRVILAGGMPAGLAAVATTSVASVNLAGIVPEHRRRGLYMWLLRSVSAQANALRVETITISTQSHNIAPMRTWSRLGWLPVLTLETVHLVRRGLLEEAGR